MELSRADRVPDARRTVLHVDAVMKRFGGVRALDGVSLAVRAGEIHGLVGTNGSGKSTLIKILAGVYQADAGTIRLGDTSMPASETSPAAARDAGLRFVHQQGSTFPELTVADNLGLGAGFETTIGCIRRARQRRRAEAVLARHRIDVSPDAPLGSLRPATRAMIAIARVLGDGHPEASRVLVLDEPTATLPTVDADLLLAALRDASAQGQAILFVSHRLDEVLELSDRVTVLTDGRVVHAAASSQLAREQLAELVTGGERSVSARARVPVGARPRSRLLLSAAGLRGAKVAEASFVLREGEIVGLAGLLGSGRSTLMRMLFGVEPVAGGSLEVDGEAVPSGSIADAIRAGVAYVPEDRPGEALFPGMSIRENLLAASVREFWARGRLSRRGERDAATAAIERLSIRPSNPGYAVEKLSGGNQQKVVLERWLRLEPKVLLLDEPTQGVDIGVRAEVHGLVARAVARGAAALVCSSDFEELALLCDRVLVMRSGRLVDELAGDVSAPRIASATLTQCR